MHSDRFNGIEILQVDGSMEKKWDSDIPADLKRLFDEWDIYVPLVTKGLMCSLFKSPVPSSSLGRNAFVLECVFFRVSSWTNTPPPLAKINDNI
jgi:hypothetical protein